MQVPPTIRYVLLSTKDRSLKEENPYPRPFYCVSFSFTERDSISIHVTDESQESVSRKIDGKRFIKETIEEIRQIEVKHEGTRYKEKYSDSTDSFKGRLHKIIENVLLRGIPQDTAAAAEGFSGGVEERRIQDFLKDMSKIDKQKTLFVLPTVTRSEEEEEFTKLSKLLSKEINEHLNSGNLDLDFSFLADQTYSTGSKADVNTKYKAPVDTLRDILVEDLFPYIVEDCLKGISFNKEGPILFVGPPGTGKTMAAKALANKNGRSFYSYNVAEIPETMIEARIRGYEKGYFTGADSARLGWFEKANGGILLLDDFQAAPQHVQTQLLDLLNATSDKMLISRLPDSEPRRFSVRVILAVNEPLKELIETSEPKTKLRKDLYDRIRQSVKFPTLSEVLRAKALNPEECSRYIRKLFWLYRWSHPSTINLYNGVNEHASSFPLIEDSAVNCILNETWDGNFRALGRVADDIFDELDGLEQGRRRIIDKQIVKSHIGRFLKDSIFAEDRPDRLSEQRVGNSINEDNEFSIECAIEKSLKDNNFNLTKAAQAVKYLQKGMDLKTFKKRIVENYGKLSNEVRDNFVIRKLMAKNNSVSEI
jgi:transcriptional regulator with AAA-type ATPase domain